MALLQTGVDVNGKQCHEFGSSEGNLKEQLVLNRAGTPGDNDYIISFDVTLAAGMGQERPGPTAAHRACDKFIQSYRDKLKKFKGDKCTERHEYHDIVRPGKKKVLIIKHFVLIAVRRTYEHDSHQIEVCIFCNNF